MAEEERFELSEGFHPRWFSRPVHSTALPPLRGTVENLTIIPVTVNQTFPYSTFARNPLILGGFRVSFFCYLEVYGALSH